MNSKIKKAIILIIVLVIILIISTIIYNYLKTKYEIEEVLEEKYLVSIQDEKAGVIDKNGNIIIEPQYLEIQIPNPSKPIFVCVYEYNWETEEYKTKVINEYGTELFTKYNKVEAILLNHIETSMPYEKSVLKYEQDGKYGLIDLKGNVVTKPIYDSIDGLENKEGELLISQNGKYGVINTKGAELIKAKYDYISGDEYYTQDKKFALSGYILGEKTSNGYRYGYMNYKRKMLLNIEYNDIMRFGGIDGENTDKDIILLAQKNGQYGLIKNKKVLIDFRYQSIDYSGISNLFLVTRNTKTGVFNSSGEKILAVKYNEIEIHETYIQTKLGDETAYYNLLGNRVDKSTIEEIKK